MIKHNKKHYIESYYTMLKAFERPCAMTRAFNKTGLNSKQGREFHTLFLKKDLIVVFPQFRKGVNYYKITNKGTQFLFDINRILEILK